MTGPSHLAQQLAHGIAKFVSVPLRMTGARLIWIANGYALNVGLAKKAKQVHRL